MSAENRAPGKRFRWIDVSTMATVRKPRPSIAPNRSIAACATAAPRWRRWKSPAPKVISAPRPRSRCAMCSLLAWAIRSRPAKATPIAPSGSPMKASASAPISARRRRNITGRAAPATKAGAPAKRRTRCRYGSGRARSGSIPPVTARCTATRPAPPSRWPCNIRTSR